MNIHQRAFEKLKPYFVCKLKGWYTCYCIAHIQMSFLRDAVNSIRQGSHGLHGLNCTCKCDICKSTNSCKACTRTFTSLTLLWELVVCPKVDGSIYHKLKCLIGECSSCGPEKKFKSCPMEESSGCTMKVKVFEDVEVGYTNAGKKKKRKIISYKQIQFKELLILFKYHLKKFIQHNFIYRWQAEQMKECILRFPEDVVVYVVNFAEIYTFKEQNGVQTMHWFSDQVPIFVHITYVHVAGVVNK